MKVLEVLGKECMSFTDLYATNRSPNDLKMAHSFLTQPLTPEWVETYLEGFEWVGLDVFTNKKAGVTYFKSIQFWYIGDDFINAKHPSHLFESLPPEIKLTYKNVEI